MLLVFCYLVLIFTLLFSKFLLSDSKFHVSKFHASVFRVSDFPLQFSHFCFSGFNFPASVGASVFHASALLISCGNKCLFSMDFFCVISAFNSRLTSPRYKQFGIKLSLFFGLAKSSKYKPIFPLSQIPKLLVACVTGRLCVLRCLRIRRYKSSLKRQHNFIRDDRLYEGSETSHAKKRGGLTKDYE